MKSKKLKLNLGCGNEKLEGYVNIDIVKTDATDLVVDAVTLKGCKENSVDEIVAYHLIEHLSYMDFQKALTTWYRILKPGGKLIIECPDLEKLCALFLKCNFSQRWESYSPGNPSLAVHIFGNRGDGTIYDFHKSGYTKDFLSFMLSSFFKNIQFTTPHKDYGCPCIRVECIKKRYIEGKLLDQT